MEIQFGESPWSGGFFELIVQSVERCLKKVLKNARVTAKQLQTVLVEEEASLNARPHICLKRRP